MAKLARKEIQEKGQEEEWGAKRRKRQEKGGMRGAIDALEKVVGKEWKRIENWSKLHKKEEKWEKRIRMETEVRIEEYGEEEKERQQKRREEEGEVLMYSDGSKQEKGVAAGVCRIGKERGVVRRIGFGLGDKMEIMDAEMVGIKKAIEVGLKDAARERKKIITVVADSQQALKRIVEREGRPGEQVAYNIRWLCDAARTQGVLTGRGRVQV